MIHAQTVMRWSAQPGWVNSLKRWTWFGENLPALIRHLAGAGPSGDLPAVDRAALSRAFWSWAATLDAYADLEALDPVDCAHFQSGMLLAQLLQERPLRLQHLDRDTETRLMTDTVLTVLAVWLQAIGAPPCSDGTPDLSAARWSSYVENVNEDASVAVAYLDLFTGREPVWNYPTMPNERPALRRALAQRRNTTA